MQHSDWDGSYFATTRIAAEARLSRRPASTIRASAISLIEVHDCFSITELVTMEDLGISQEGKASATCSTASTTPTGKIPCQIDGGLKCFGHPIGASGLRMIYEMYLQLLGRAGERQRPDSGARH